MQHNLEDLVRIRDSFFIEQENLYLSMVNQINSNMKDLLNNDLGGELAKNCLQEISAQIVTRYIPISQTGNKFITAREMYNRIVNFSYENDYDPLYANNQEIREMMYQNTDPEFLNIISEESKGQQTKLFTEDRALDKLDRKGKLDYRESKRDEKGDLYDELTGIKEEKKTILKNNKEVEVSDLHADHIQSREAATYNSEYIRDDKVEELKKFYNSPDNFQIIHASANSSKQDVRVYDPKTGEDITYKATAEQLADATIDKWENGFENRDNKGVALKEKLHNKGYADKVVNKDGSVEYKIKKDVRKKLIENTKKSMNAESMVILKNADYAQIGKRALQRTAKDFFNILSGQLIYYGLPPVVYETRRIIQNKNSDVDNFFEKIAKSFSRIIKYIQGKLGDIFRNVAHNSLRTFVMSFFDILIKMLKATVKRVMQMIRDIVMALINSIKILQDKNRTAAEKADAIFTTLGITISSVAVNVLIELAEANFPWIKPFTDPLQIIITVVVTNIVMIILQKMDIFNVRYGLMVNRIHEIFEEGRNEYKEKLKALEDETYSNIDNLMNQVESDIFDTMTNMASLNIYEDDFKDEIDKINKTFNMGIDLELEWAYYTSN